MGICRAASNRANVLFERLTFDANQYQGTQLQSVVLYTRAGCHLCDDALELLRGHDVEPVLVDIDADPVLRKKFNDCIPVVEIDGKIRFRGRVDPLLLGRFIR